MTKMLKNSILLPIVSTLLSPIVVSSCVPTLKELYYRKKQEMRLIFKYGAVGPSGLNQVFSLT